MLHENVNYIHNAPEGEVQSKGFVLNYIEPDREGGDLTGAYIVRDDNDGETHEVDERDVWRI